ncbi:hypothetical protein QZH41_013637, partial [Actinostola sp. cb2023]
GIMTTDFGAEQEKLTTVRYSYQEPRQLGIRTTGTKEEHMRAEFMQQVADEFHEESNPPPPPVEYLSTTHKDYNKEFEPMVKEPTRAITWINDFHAFILPGLENKMAQNLDPVPQHIYIMITMQIKTNLQHFGWKGIKKYMEFRK